MGEAMKLTPIEGYCDDVVVEDVVTCDEAREMVKKQCTGVEYVTLLRFIDQAEERERNEALDVPAWCATLDKLKAENAKLRAACEFTAAFAENEDGNPIAATIAVMLREALGKGGGT
jgi:hypothetical protein